MEQVSITSAYMWSIVIMVVAFFITVIISNLIKYKPSDSGTTTRRIWFWVLCVAASLVGFVINYIIGKTITVPSIQGNYLMHAGIAAGVCVVVYILIGIVVSKLFPNSKVGTWF